MTLGGGEWSASCPGSLTLGVRDPHNGTPTHIKYVTFPAARFEVFMAVKILVKVFWVVMPCSVRPEDRCSMDF
jgi:hypothetical protein